MRAMEIQVLDSRTLHIVLAGAKEDCYGSASDELAKQIAEQRGFDPKGSRYVSPVKRIRGNEYKLSYEFYKRK
ncbi:hypothetical protein M5X11_28060 [Paenibacillus alginolyticus]|uniref:hypothetical protein n=1 Tax=Paenibacillus alginolyticus TaxID=59839 RepID=UPI00040AAFC2|nr:hypothetical protein [Paenibacillus alginolyticus]MCY9668733.1 hypothetical protein [Paenibacillus alginolyticus]